jgi:S-adenosyl methyltransferase
VVFIDSSGQWWRPAPDGPAGIDLTVPSPARMYDYYLGGKDHFPADREAAEKALALVPSGRELARANRDFLVRAVTYLAGQGIDQFIDIGTGLPASPNVHEVARSVIPDARVAYVDNDALVMAHARAMLADSPDVIAVHGDARRPFDFITHDAVRELINFSRPAAVLFAAVLHFVTDEEHPHGSVAWVRDRMAPGSYLVLSHVTSDGTDPAAMNAIQDAYKEASAPAVFRTTREIAWFFDGFELAPPGLAEVARWRNPHPDPVSAPAAVRLLGAVGRKPGDSR